MVTTYTLLTNNVDTRDPIGSKNSMVTGYGDLENIQHSKTVEISKIYSILYIQVI